MNSVYSYVDVEGCILDLDTFIRTTKSDFEVQSNIWVIMYHIMSGLEFIHERDWIHRAIVPSNSTSLDHFMGSDTYVKFFSPEKTVFGKLGLLKAVSRPAKPTELDSTPSSPRIYLTTPRIPHEILFQRVGYLASGLYPP